MTTRAVGQSEGADAVSGFATRPTIDPLPIWTSSQLHIVRSEPTAVPEAAGDPVVVDLVLTTRESKAATRTYFNTGIWKPALIAAGFAPTRENGCHALRHHYASVLLDAGESIKAVSEALGHSDPAFTLRTYTHLMPTSHDRTRRAIDQAWSRVTGVSAVAK